MIIDTMELDAKDCVLPNDTLWIDIETRKAPAPDSWPQRLRWQPFMIGIAGVIDPGVVYIDIVSSDDEADLISYLIDSYGNKQYVARYSATREFDEMVLKGRFTNARRAHHLTPGPWPHIPNDLFIWENMRLQSRLDRSGDILSKDVPALWSIGKHDEVKLHCFMDVTELLLLDPEVKLSEENKRFLSSSLSSRARV